MSVEHDPARDRLLALNRRCATMHSVAVVVVLVLVLGCIGAGMAVAQRWHLEPVLGLLPAVPACAAGLYAVFKADQWYARRVGFTCPACRQSLYFISDRYRRSPLLARGQCPQCGVQLMAPA